MVAIRGITPCNDDCLLFSCLAVSLPVPVPATECVCAVINVGVTRICQLNAMLGSDQCPH